MESCSLGKLCQNLIGSAFQRCRLSESLCRLSVVLKRSSSSNLPIVRISISDTGLGSCLEDFQNLDYASNNVSAGNWDGVLSVTTTSICDEVIYHYHLNLKENDAARRLKKLPPSPKNGGKFSGTEISLSTYESIDELFGGMIYFLQKMVILKIPGVTVELVVDHTESCGSRCEHLFLANEGIHFPFPGTDVERLVSGLEDHVLKHGNTLEKACQSCFSSRENLKVGSGTACSSENLRNTGQVINAVIIITECPASSNPHCLKACGTTTEVLYFQDFLLCTIPRSSVGALTSIDWKSYGLNMIANDLGEDGNLVLKWENLPPYSHIDIIIHCYHKQTLQVRQKILVDKSLVKKAVKLAMDDLKEKYEGSLLSAQALKIQSYVPDLARTIGSLIMSSNDLEFRGECVSLLGLQHQQVNKDDVEDCISKKITNVILTNDRKPTRGRESAPVLFEDESIPEVEYQDEDYVDEEDFSIFDI